MRSPNWNVWSGQRALDPDVAKATALLSQFKIYPYAERDNPPETKHVRPEGKPWSATQPRGMDYWVGLDAMIQQEPAEERDKLILAMLRPLGIERSKPFAPDARQTKILTDAAQIGEVMAGANSYAKRFPGSKVWPDRRWEFSLFLDKVTQQTDNFTQLDERASWFYEAVGVTDGMLGKMVGIGQVYLELQKDTSGAWLDGGKSYHLRVPPDAPVAQFWSFTVYDNETRALIDTGSTPDRSSRDDIVKNADGSVDLYFGPSPPVAGMEKNWIKTTPDKGWFTYFRLYGPTQAFFDRTWTLNDIEEVKYWPALARPKQKHQWGHQPSREADYHDRGRASAIMSVIVT